MEITIERPKTVDLEELLGIRLFFAPGCDGQDLMTRKEIVLGQRSVSFTFSRQCVVNCAQIYWPQKTVHPIGNVIQISHGDTIDFFMRWK